MIRYAQDDSRVTMPHLDPAMQESLSAIEENLKLSQMNVAGHKLFEVEKILNQCCAIGIDEVVYGDVDETLQDLVNKLFEMGYEYNVNK